MVTVSTPEPQKSTFSPFEIPKNYHFLKLRSSCAKLCSELRKIVLELHSFFSPFLRPKSVRTPKSDRINSNSVIFLRKRCYSPNFSKFPGLGYVQPKLQLKTAPGPHVKRPNCPNWAAVSQVDVVFEHIFRAGELTP